MSAEASRLAVVAFGGNALLRQEDRGTQEEQIARAKQAARWLAEIVRHGYKLLVVHEFTSRMLPNRDQIHTHHRIEVTFHADGFGSPRQKIGVSLTTKVNPSS